jgi:hypothetical protein
VKPLLAVLALVAVLATCSWVGYWVELLMVGL